VANRQRLIRSAYIKLLPSILCITVTLFAGFAAATAWFSMNNKVDATGMKVSLNVKDPYLVIAKTAQDLYDAQTADVSVTYGEESHAYVPVTHDDTSSPCLLKYASNANHVDAETGLADDVTFSPVPSATDNGSYYFAEFDVYIGALHCELTGTDLTATWDEDLLSAVLNDRQKAASIDFYVWQSGSFQYVTSTNLADKQTVTLLSDTVIPHSKSGNSIRVRMRFYYDGALTYESEGEQIAYIRTGDVEASNVSLGISFHAEPHAAS